MKHDFIVREERTMVLLYFPNEIFSAYIFKTICVTFQVTESREEGSVFEAISLVFC